MHITLLQAYESTLAPNRLNDLAAKGIIDLVDSVHTYNAVTGTWLINQKPFFDAHLELSFTTTVKYQDTNDNFARISLLAQAALTAGIKLRFYWESETTDVTDPRFLFKHENLIAFRDAIGPIFDPVDSNTILSECSFYTNQLHVIPEDFLAELRYSKAAVGRQWYNHTREKTRERNKVRDVAQDKVARLGTYALHNLKQWHENKRHLLGPEIHGLIAITTIGRFFWSQTGTAPYDSTHAYIPPNDETILYQLDQLNRTALYMRRSVNCLIYLPVRDWENEELDYADTHLFYALRSFRLNTPLPYNRTDRFDESGDMAYGRKVVDKLKIGDFDLDNDVDMTDFSTFAANYTGPG